MMAVVSGPPQWAPLGRTGAQYGKHELGGSTGLECLVGKVAMIEASDGKHPNDKKDCGKHDGKRADASENASRQARCNAIKGSTLTQLKDLELESR